VIAASKKRWLIGLSICALFAVLGILALSTSRGSTVPVVSVLASDSNIQEGPGGRTALTEWTLRKDPTDLGLKRGFARGQFNGQKVRVPDTVNPLPVTGTAGEQNYEGSIAWYRTSLRVSRAGLYAVSFQSANFLATVWIDGHELGTHEGTYLPFEFDRELSAGAHTLVVRVDWRSPQAQTQAGFHRTWFNFGGINGEVTLRRLADSTLSDPDMQTVLHPDWPNAGRASVTLSVQVHNYGPAREIGPAGTLERGHQQIPITFTDERVGHEKTVTMTAHLQIAKPRLWSPAHPNLYRLSLAIGQESSYSAWVGIRELSWHSGRLYLNGRRLILHGASIQEEARGEGDALSAADQDHLVAELEAIGANATRSQHPLDPALLERLDAAGILVWQGVGPVDPAGDWSDRTPALMRQAEQQVRTTVTADQLHPSIIAWNLANEVAGNGHPGGQIQYVQKMAGWLHTYDPGRMVALDVWGEHPPKRAGAIYHDLDAISETDYSGWYEIPGASAAQLGGLIDHRLQAMHRTFPGKVQIVSEFGAEANSLNPSRSPGGYAYQSRLLTEHIDAYERDPYLSGMLVWDLRDFALTPTFAGGSISAVVPGIKLIKGLNQKGLFTYEGAPKPAEPVVAKLFKALPE